MHEQFAHVAVSSLADTEKPLLSAGRVFSRHEAEPRGALTAMLERRRIASGRHERRGSQGANPGELGQPLTRLSRREDLREAVVGGRQPLLQGLECLGKGLQPLPCCGRQAMLRLFEHKRPLVPNRGRPLRDHDPICRKQSTDLMDERGPGFDLPLAAAVQCLHILLGDRLHRYAAHPEPFDGCADTRGIVGIIFLALESGSRVPLL